MNKSLLIVLIIVALLVSYYLAQPERSSVIELQTQQEAAQEIKQVETIEEATDLTMEKIDEEFSGIDDDFEEAGISDEALEI